MRFSGLSAHTGRLLRLTEAQDLIEYAILIALVSITLLITVTEVGDKVPGLYQTTDAAMPGGLAEPDDSDDPVAGHPGRHGNPGSGNPGNDKPVGNPGPGNPGGGKK